MNLRKWYNTSISNKRMEQYCKLLTNTGNVNNYVMTIATFLEAYTLHRGIDVSISVTESLTSLLEKTSKGGGITGDVAYLCWLVLNNNIKPVTESMYIDYSGRALSLCSRHFDYSREGILINVPKDYFDVLYGENPDTKTAYLLAAIMQKLCNNNTNDIEKSIFRIIEDYSNKSDLCVNLLVGTLVGIEQIPMLLERNKTKPTHYTNKFNDTSACDKVTGLPIGEVREYVNTHIRTYKDELCNKGIEIDDRNLLVTLYIYSLLQQQ